MLAKVNADYSQFPNSIRDIMPFVEGELSELRNYWQVYHYFFMDNEGRTIFFAERFGPLFGIFQNLLEERMILSISCLTDKDTKIQRNLSLWSLTAAISFAKEKDFEQKVNLALDAITATVSKIRTHRHKLIAHFDREVGSGASQLPTVFYKEFKLALEQMEEFLNLFHWEFAKTTVGFDALSSGEIFEAALVTACKAKVYDELESENKISFGEWERRVEKWPWWSWH
jgi:AbiU2